MLIVLCIVCLAVMAIWMVAEWLLFGSVAGIRRNPALSSRAKAWALVVAVADIPLVCLSTYNWFWCILCWPFRTPNGYCIHLWNCPELPIVGCFMLLVEVLVVAPIIPFLGMIFLPLVFCCTPFPDLGEAMNFCLFSIYITIGAFLRGMIMWRSSNRSKWRMAFVFLVTYWPLALLSFLMGLASEAANYGGCCDFLD